MGGDDVFGSQEIEEIVKENPLNEEAGKVEGNCFYPIYAIAGKRGGENRGEGSMR